MVVETGYRRGFSEEEIEFYQNIVNEGQSDFCTSNLVFKAGFRVRSFVSGSRGRGRRRRPREVVLIVDTQRKQAFAFRDGMGLIDVLAADIYGDLVPGEKQEERFLRDLGLLA